MQDHVEFLESSFLTCLQLFLFFFFSKYHNVVLLIIRKTIFRDLELNEFALSKKLFIKKAVSSSILEILCLYEEMLLTYLIQNA